jgi:hypothetical protein
VSIIDLQIVILHPARENFSTGHEKSPSNPGGAAIWNVQNTILLNWCGSLLNQPEEYTTSGAWLSIPRLARS